MHMVLVAVGQRLPAWVQEGYRDFARRLPAECPLRLIEIAAPRRGRRADIGRLVDEEGKRMLAAVPAGAVVVALDMRGRPWTTEDLAARLAKWLAGGRDVAFLVGGPDGLAAACLAAADQIWSLSPLTLPHALVRVVLAEQIYRAWTIHRRHPYHRA